MMALLSFTFILLLLLFVEKLLLAPLHFLVTIHLPTWFSLVVTMMVLSWLIGE